MQALQLASHLNMAMCHLKLQVFSAATENSIKAQEADSNDETHGSLPCPRGRGPPGGECPGRACSSTQQQGGRGSAGHVPAADPQAAGGEEKLRAHMSDRLAEEASKRPRQQWLQKCRLTWR